MKNLIIILICAGSGILYAQQNNTEEMRRHIRYAQTAYSAGEFNDALKEYKTAQTFAPNYPELHKAIAEVYEKLGGSINLTEAINSYRNYLKLAPNAKDSREILDKIYTLEYLHKKAEEQDKILSDITGRWVAINNIQIINVDDVTGNILWSTDYVFDIAEVIQSGKHTGVYRITIQSAGCRLYSESIIEKTVTVTVTKDNFLNFTFADAQVYTPNPAKYDSYRIFGNILSAATNKSWIGDLTNSAVNAYQAVDLPSNTQTAYNFTLNYDEGRLVGMVNILQKFADPNTQKTTQNKLEEITFVKRDENFYDKLKNVSDNKPDILTERAGVVMNNYYLDRHGKKVSNKDVYTKMQAVDIDLAEQYKKVVKKESTCFVVSMIGSCTLGGGIGLLIPAVMDTETDNTNLLGIGVLASLSGGLILGVAMPICIRATKKRQMLVSQYNNQLIQNRNKPTAELRFGFTPSGNMGLTLNF
ncbi:MAG: tetratricopeptide repeat protein [Bacteroidales bacterium]|jgi:tetratricopeptide (TPR) repeat protein|nr:tetratricopeptide repeat protein [Bacteroidales bacterium]